MEFDAALDTVKKYLHISLDNEYDGIIVKKMAKSNLIGEENSTGNQTHIAITGAQRDAFPYICAAQYLTCPHEDIDDTIKRFFMCQIKVNIYRSNVEPLDKANTIRFGAGQEKKSVYTTVWRRRGRNNEEQVQLSALNLDDSDFVEFRKLIHTADYIVILKLQACLEYDWFIIPKESIADSDDLKALDGKFIHKSTSTIVKIDQNVQMDAVLNNEKIIVLPTSTKECAKSIIDYVYDLDEFKLLQPILKSSNATIKADLQKLQNLGLPTKSLRYLFILPTSLNYNAFSTANGKQRVFEKNYKIPVTDGKYIARLTTQWKDSPLDDDFDGNSLTALIRVVNEYYSHYLEIVKTDNGYCLKIKNETTKGIIESANILFYGVPGCGKSHTVGKKYESKVKEEYTIRVVFHPDYTYSDFVGQIMPVLEKVENKDGIEEEKLQYKFIPGPFTRILQLAEIHKDQQCLLIIEELNRGNAPAIFGEIFQLLDRNDDGTSRYGIYNSDIAEKVYGDKNKSIKLPSNLTIVATMNTSDQNVFTMDTAFQRRWQMKHIPNRFTGESLDEKTINHVAKHLPNSEISWGVFAQTVNKKMHTANLGFGGTEDKSLGVYFATDNDLDDAERFAEKVLKYLWDDAFKLGRKELFNDCSQGLSAVIEAYEDAAKAKIEKQSAEDPLKKVLVPEVYNEMQKKMAEMAAEQAQTAEEKTSEEEAAESAAEDNPAQEPAGEE